MDEQIKLAFLEKFIQKHKLRIIAPPIRLNHGNMVIMPGKGWYYLRSIEIFDRFSIELYKYECSEFFSSTESKLVKETV